MMPELLELDELLDDDELLLELELLLDEELELLEDELDVPPQSAAPGLTPVIEMESMFASPPLPVACKRIVLKPAFRFTVTEPESVQLVHAPVVGKSTLVTVPPFTCTFAGRLLEPFAYRHSSR
jgi:hypothetical protein